jgi:hypothetical protein
MPLLFVGQVVGLPEDELSAGCVVAEIQPVEGLGNEASNGRLLASPSRTNTSR